MSYKVEILADSRPFTENGERLTTMVLTFPRIILAEINTHRSHARNCESSRAIPAHKKIKRVMDEPFIPEFTSEQKGMQGGDELTLEAMASAEVVWINARDSMVDYCNQLIELGIHKQTANRLIEPFSWVTDIMSATSAGWANFFHLRTSKLAQPEFKIIARMAYDAYKASMPKVLSQYEAHTPLMDEDTLADLVQKHGYDEQSHPRYGPVYQVMMYDRKKISSARCARVSYLTHEGLRSIEDDMTLFNRLVDGGHWSPLEHVAEPCGGADKGDSGCLDGEWLQFRKEFSKEFVTSFSGYDDE